ncbi:MAG: hypothetical protein Q7R96_01885 [Nanoarchaeota archaeon]|nr:hypothetical protein [Nanoarchaeota archaeon]
MGKRIIDGRIVSLKKVLFKKDDPKEEDKAAYYLAEIFDVHKRTTYKVYINAENKPDGTRITEQINEMRLGDIGRFKIGPSLYAFDDGAYERGYEGNYHYCFSLKKQFEITDEDRWTGPTWKGLPILSANQFATLAAAPEKEPTGIFSFQGYSRQDEVYTYHDLVTTHLGLTEKIKLLVEGQDLGGKSALEWTDAGPQMIHHYQLKLHVPARIQRDNKIIVYADKIDSVEFLPEIAPINLTIEGIIASGQDQETPFNLPLTINPHASDAHLRAQALVMMVKSELEKKERPLATIDDYIKELDNTLGPFIPGRAQ